MSVLKMHAPGTVGALVTETTARFTAAGIGDPQIDARFLIAGVLGLAPSQLFARYGDKVTAETMRGVAEGIRRRLAHEPVSRILGRREFWGLDFKVTADVLDPRPDTETLVETALSLQREFADRPVRVLDLGTGTGCILLAVLTAWPEAHGTGVDISAAAVDIATANARALGLAARAQFKAGDWCRGLEGAFELVVSNPPYIPRADIVGLAPDVARFDPVRALDGGDDGLAAYRAILGEVRRILALAGRVLFEVGVGQIDGVAALAKDAGFRVLQVRPDIAGVPRCLVVG